MNIIRPAGIGGLFMMLITFQLNGQIREVDHWETVFYNDTYFNFKTSADAVTATDWRNPGFDDSGWNTGRGGIGYGDQDDNTETDAVASVFMRTNFTIPDTSEIGAAILNMSYDDAFVAYLNGTEIARSQGLTDAFPAYNVLSSANHDATMLNGGVPESFVIEENILKSNLVEGTNVLAVQVHNVSLSSSDMSSNTWLHVGLKTGETRYLQNPEWFAPPVFASFSSNLPILVIDTENNQSIPDEPKITARLGIIYNGAGQSNHSNDPFNEYNGFIGIERRGNSTQGFPKKPYNFETRDSSGFNLNVSILGMPAENDWVLRASYMDHTFVRNGLADFMSRETGRWASRTKHVEVILNGEYQGIYVLMEKLKRDDNRLDIARLDSNEIAGEDLTGGYIWEITGFDNHFGESRKIKYPKIDEIQPEQLQYIQTVDDGFRDKMRELHSVYADPNTGYVEHINVESFLFEAIVQEAMRNSDAYGWSGYYHKDKNGLIHAGPVWDFDQSSGNSSYPDNGVVEGWLMEHPHTSNTPFYWPLLLNESFFRFSLKLRWEEMRADKFSDDKLLSYIDSVANLLEEAQVREFAKWPVLGANIWRETYGYQERDTYQKEIDYLKVFLEERWAWIDDQLADVQRPDGYPDITSPGAFSDTILYTTTSTHYFNLDSIFSYPYASGLQFIASSSDTSVVKTRVMGSDTLRLKASQLGLSDIHIVAKDTYGNKRTISFNVEYQLPVDTTFTNNPDIAARKLEMFPNPARGVVNIRLTGDQSVSGKLAVFDLAGLKVDELYLNNVTETRYHTTDLSSGIYIISLQTEEGFSYSGKLVVH